MPFTDIEIGWRTQLSGETRPWGIDFTAEMDSGDAVGATTATLTDLLTGQSYPSGLSGTPTVSGNIATQVVTWLLAGHNYRLVLTANMGGQKLTSSTVNLSCPY